MTFADSGPRLGGLCTIEASAAWKSTGIKGLDEILRGEMPENRRYLVEGVLGTRYIQLSLTATGPLKKTLQCERRLPRALPMGTLGEGTRLDWPLPPNMNFYTLRGVESHVASNSVQAFAFVKMGPAVCLGFIQPPPPGSWIGTKVALGEGQVGGHMGMSRDFLDYFIERAKRVRQAVAGRSARQNAKIKISIAENMGRAAASGTFRALDADVKRFGADRVFSTDDAEPEAEGGTK